ncbi:hypothetical protein PORCRE_1741 [Porphyromonas crevioricanis JCM 15906]|uniref:Uncharacterized protein n=1 Tax=Porphyromonas crevioricanis JCM 15906 TaxID=1305617 RepID=T1CIN4_9PORP|nr:hypothetical protein PORCRE_1741 [Porphyromonas crevioricanis JCM 15906]
MGKSPSRKKWHLSPNDTMKERGDLAYLLKSGVEGLPF